MIDDAYVETEWQRLAAQLSEADPRAGAGEGRLLEAGLALALMFGCSAAHHLAKDTGEPAARRARRSPD